VLVQYPNDSRHCWSPATIFDKSELNTTINFYNNFRKTFINSEYAIPINKDTYESFVEKRKTIRRTLIGKIIIGFNNHAREFMEGDAKQLNMSIDVVVVFL
jgi:hypothetical protein